MPNLLAEMEIMRFCNFVKNYDYSQLRAEKKGKENAPLYQASEVGIRAFLAGFDNTMRLSADTEVRQYFKGLQQQPVSELKNILLLAEALLTLRKNIYETELRHHLNVRQMPEDLAIMHSTLRESHLWVLYFHFTIEQRIEAKELNELRPLYGKVIPAIQQLGAHIYSWLLKNAPQQALPYRVLSNPDQPLLSSPPRASGAKRFNFFDTSDPDQTTSKRSKLFTDDVSTEDSSEDELGQVIKR